MTRRTFLSRVTGVLAAMCLPLSWLRRRSEKVDMMKVYCHGTTWTWVFENDKWHLLNIVTGHNRSPIYYIDGERVA